MTVFVLAHSLCMAARQLLLWRFSSSGIQLVSPGRAGEFNATTEIPSFDVPIQSLRTEPLKTCAI